MYDADKLTESEKVAILEKVSEICNKCVKCDLSKSRTQAVFSDGNPKASLMLIGEAPGKNEDETGKPFVGRAGQLLDKILLKYGISRETDIYICNTVKCRPPENRVPTKEELQACREYLDTQLQLIKPKIILLCGATAVKSFIDTKLPISKIRGEWFDGPFGSKMMPIFHPSYLLRNHSLEEGKPRWLMDRDIEKVKAELTNN